MHIIRIEARSGIRHASTVHIEPVAYSSPRFRYSRLEPSSCAGSHGEYPFVLLIRPSVCKAQSHLFATRRPKTEAHSVVRDLRAIRHVVKSCQHAFPSSLCSTFCVASAVSVAAWFHRLTSIEIGRAHV